MVCEVLLALASRTLILLGSEMEIFLSFLDPLENLLPKRSESEPFTDAFLPFSDPFLRKPAPAKIFAPLILLPMDPPLVKPVPEKKLMELTRAEAGCSRTTYSAMATQNLMWGCCVKQS
jgi:hypothetical protein